MPLDMSNFQYRGMGAYWTGRNLANGFGSATTADAVARAFAKHLAGRRVLVTGTDSGIGREAAKALLNELNAGAVVDRYLADQLIPFVAVSGGSLQTSGITGHTRSCIYVAEQVLGAKFEVEGLTITARR